MKPAAVWLMLPAGIVDGALVDLAPMLQTQATFSLTAATLISTTRIQRRPKVGPKGLHFVSTSGTSGALGVWSGVTA